MGLTIGRQIRLLDRLTEGEPDRGVVLVGSSMGAYVAALFAARDPCVAAQVLMAPALDFGRRFVQGLGEEAAAAWKREGSLPVQHFGEGRMTRIGWGLVEDALRHPPFPEVRVPTVIIHGRRDEVVPCTLSEELAARHPGVELVLVDSDHGLADAVRLVVERIWRVLREAGDWRPRPNGT